MVDAGLLKHQAMASQDLPPEGANKWEVLRELSEARQAYGLSDRDISVLQALLSFYPKTILGGNDCDLIVYPSNASICERLNGMANSTMRRHLGHLVDAGVIVRRDSPNGKRYARRYGTETVAFGFDLSPLVQRLPEFCATAEEIRADRDRLTRLRETVSLMRRDLAGLAEYGASTRPDLGLWDQFSDLAILTARDLRRKLSYEELETLQKVLQDALDQARDCLDGVNTKNMSTNDATSEQHYQNSNTYSNDSELCEETAKGQGGAERIDAKPLDTDTKVEADSNLPNIPLGLVLATCHEFKTYTPEPVRHWHQLVQIADTLRPMMGISPSAWDEARHVMGPEEAAVVVVAMLERFSEIRSAGGYLRSLTTHAMDGAFSCGPMIMALMRREAA